VAGEGISDRGFKIVYKKHQLYTGVFLLQKLYDTSAECGSEIGEV
jgi:hypothetical protein